MKSYRCLHGADLLAAYTPAAHALVLSNRPTVVQLRGLELEIYIDWLVAAYASLDAGEPFPFEHDFDVAIDTSKNQVREQSLSLH